MSAKVVVIGLDGATFDVIRPMIKEGDLPNISSLIDSGTSGVLKSTIPDLSPVAWTSMITGRKPGNHAIYDFMTRKRDSYDFRGVRGGDRVVKPVWSFLSDKGKKVGVINVTMSYPPEKVNGFIVSGIDAPGVNEDYTYPPSVQEDLKKGLGSYNIINPASFMKSKEEHLNGLFKMIDTRQKAADLLTKKYDPDFTMIVFIETDGAQHFYWKDMDKIHPDHNTNTPERFKNAIPDVYRKMDEYIGTLVNRYSEDTTFMLVSDHGFHGLHKIFILNNWLSEKGFLCFKEETLASRSMGRLSSLAGKVKNRLSLKKRSPRDNSRNPATSIEWENTKAYSDGAFGYIYVNLIGREPLGIVEPGDEYEQVRNDIMSGLMEVRDPENGLPVVERVYKREEIFTGPFFEEAPDIIATSREHYFVSSAVERTPLAEKRGKDKGLFQKHIWSGNHCPEGIFVIKGPGVKEGHTITDAAIVDITPTILYLMNQEIPGDMDGDLLSDAFTNDYLKENSPVYSEPGDLVRENDSASEGERHFSETEEEAVKERLRGLGYID